MNWFTAFLSGLLRNDWRELDSAPFDREIELAFIDGDINLSRGPGLRHGDGWLDVETLRPVEIAATHWRYRQSVLPPMSCC